MNEYYTTKEVSERYKVTEQTIRRWINEGIIKGAIKMGKRWLFNKRVIDTDLSEIEAANYIPGRVEKQPWGSPFDLLHGDTRFEVKSSKLYFDKNKKSYWSFNGIKKEKFDWIMCLGYDEKKKKVINAYMLPANEIKKVSLKIRLNERKYKKYLIHKTDIPTFLRK